MCASRATVYASAYVLCVDLGKKTAPVWLTAEGAGRSGGGAGRCPRSALTATGRGARDGRMLCGRGRGAGRGRRARGGARAGAGESGHASGASQHIRPLELFTAAGKAILVTKVKTKVQGRGSNREPIVRTPLLNKVGHITYDAQYSP